MTIMTIQRITGLDVLWLKRSKPFPSGSYMLRQTGLVSSMLGLQGHLFSSVIENQSFGHITLLSWNSFELYQRIPWLLLSMMLKSMTNMLANHFSWMINSNSIIPFLLKCPALMSLLPLHILCQSGVHCQPLEAISSASMPHAVIGAMVHVSQILTLTSASMAFAVFVVKDIEPRTTSNASLLSKLDSE